MVVVHADAETIAVATEGIAAVTEAIATEGIAAVAIVGKKILTNKTKNSRTAVFCWHSAFVSIKLFV